MITVTTCTCGDSIELVKNSVGWLTHKCKCGTNIRVFKGKMIIESNKK